MRLDEYVHGEGYTESRAKAQDIILAGCVFVNGVKVENGDRIVLCGGESIRMANTEVQFVVEGEDETLC